MEPTTGLPRPGAPASGSETCPLFKPTQEVRFAIVMYGGVSLAIYMNGVAQELLHLVRATAPERPVHTMMDALAAEESDERRLQVRALLSDDERSPQGVRSSEKVYRKLGKMLALAGVDERAGGGPAIRTRFVVDVISGTSAGGINGIFLAKALACNLPMRSLQELWVKEGDLARLLNDATSYGDLEGLQPDGPPASLLNSRRMYFKLLHAFQKMEEDGGGHAAGSVSPYVDELDLFVTTTDIAGLVAPIRLADRTVFERRHKKVFQFRYASDYATGREVNDFGAENNPFLAFAARCTSSFPFAFEPMRLREIDGFLNLPSFAARGYGASDSEAWRQFYPEYLQVPAVSEPAALQKKRAERAAAFALTAFGDGGYLDNKPFSYATETLRRRRADLPVNRKLLYVEPSPEHPELEAQLNEKPDALQNVQKALLSLPRYETIREDIEQVRSYNRLIQRLRVVLDGREADVRQQGGRSSPVKLPSAQWRQQDLTEMIKLHGIAYGSYHRLKVAYVTDELSLLFARLSGFDEDSDERLALRYLVGAWRGQTFTLYKDPQNSDKRTENEFLFQFDLWWRMRRLNFVQSRIDELSGASPEELGQRLGGISGLRRKLVLKSSELDAFRVCLLQIKCGLNTAYVDLRRTARSLRTRKENEAACAALAELGLESQELLEILENPTDEDRREAARTALAEHGLKARFQQFADAVQQVLSDALRRSAHDCERMMGQHREESSDSPSSEDIWRFAGMIEKGPARVIEKARVVLKHYYDNFEQYDMITFPIVYETGIEEAGEVEILRVSPEDANDLYDERTGTRRCSPDERATHGIPRLAAGRGKPKLAGTSLGHFGAFLFEPWRVSDILWGRLDGAERIIGALLPAEEQKTLRDELILEAQREILSEELQPSQKVALEGVVKELLDLAKLRGMDAGRAQKLANQSQAARERQAAENLERFLLAVSRPGQKDRLQRIVESFVEADRLAEFFIDDSQSNRTLPPEPTLLAAARATEIVGKMLDDLAVKYRAPKAGQRWIGMVAWLGRVFWGLVEAAVPQSAWNLIVRHWLHLLYAFELILLSGGALLGQENTVQFGWTALGITGGLHLLLYLLGGVMEGRKKPMQWVKRIAIFLVIALALFGGYQAYSLIRKAWYEWQKQPARISHEESPAERPL